MKQKTKEKKERIFEIDLLRCLPIFVVMLYHLCYDFSLIPTIVSNYQEVIWNYPNLDSFLNFAYQTANSSIILDVIAPLVGSIFLFISGISTVFSKNNVKRGFLLLCGSLLVSLTTWLIDFILQQFGSADDVFIGFGILHVMAVSILLYGIFEWIVHRLFHKEIPSIIMLIVGTLILFMGITLRNGVIIGGKEVIWPLDYSYGDPLTQVNHFSYTVFFDSAIGRIGNVVDWWPILPYSGVIYIGMAFGKVLYKDKKSLVPKLNLKVFKPLCFIGRHTIYFYLLHQPIFILILAIVFFALGFRI